MARTFNVRAKFGDACAELSDEERSEFFVAVMAYGLFEEEPVIESRTVRMVFAALKEDIDFSAQAYANGSKGGRPKRVSNPPSEPPSKTMVSNPPSEPQPQTQTNKQANKQTTPKGVEGARFAPPTPQEAQAYADGWKATKGIRTPFDAERFCDFYGSKGWKVGKTPMKDWKAAVRGWIQRDKGVTPDAEPVFDY